MILGKIVGRITTTEFHFSVSAPTQKLDYVQVYHEDYGFVLCQILEIVRDTDATIAQCNIIGYKSEEGTIKSPRIPFANASEVLRAEDEVIQQVVRLTENSKGALIGKLEGRNIDVYLDLQTLLTKHISVLAKSGAGKSYCVGVLLEEILAKKVPLLIIDPHGEYDSLRYKTQEKEVELAKYGLKPKGFLKDIQIYGDPEQTPGCKPLLIPESLQAQELLDILPSKLSPAQEGILYSALKQLDTITFDGLQAMIEAEESPAKWNVIKLIDHIRDYGIFSKSPIPYNEMIRGSKCSIMNMRGIPPHVQQIFVYKVLKDLFELRKSGKVPPFFCVIEEAHNFCPERSFGNAVSSPILRTIASEGRKFGLGLAVISQRPARVDKSVLSQVSTQIVLKVTNPNDLKTLTNTIEGLTSNSEKEIQQLAIGHALVTGVVDVPLFVDIRPRMTQHGGTTVNILDSGDQEKEFFEELEDFNEEELVPIIETGLTKKDLAVIAEKGQTVKTALIPCALFLCESKGEQYTVLLEQINGNVITDVAEFSYAKLPDLAKLSSEELNALKSAFEMKTFTLDGFMKKFSHPFSVQNELNSLVKRKYLECNSGIYKLSELYVLSQLSNYAFYQKIEYKKVGYDKKLSARYSFDTLKENLSKFANVKDFRECFIVKHELINS